MLTNAGDIAHWAFDWLGAEPSDFATHLVTLQARDGLGNRTSQPLTFQMTLDNVAPRVTVTQVATQLSLGATQTVLAGTATDSGPALQTWVLVDAPRRPDPARRRRNRLGLDVRPHG